RSLKVDWLRHEVVTYAMQQNYVPIVRKVLLRNDSEMERCQVKVTSAAESEFARMWTKLVDVLPAGQSVDLGAVHVQLDGVFLAGLTERLTGMLKLDVADEGGILYAEESPITVLAYDQWAGLSVMPEMAVA